MLASVRNNLHPYIGMEGRDFAFIGDKTNNDFQNYAQRVSNYLDIIERKTNITISVPAEGLEDIASDPIDSKKEIPKKFNFIWLSRNWEIKDSQN